MGDNNYIDTHQRVSEHNCLFFIPFIPVLRIIKTRLCKDAESTNLKNKGQVNIPQLMEFL